MNWVVVTRDAYDRFCSDNPTDDDTELRLQVAAWALLLQMTRPPPDGEFDPYRRTWKAALPGLSVTAEYLVLPYLEPPAIVVRKYERQ